MPLSAGEKLGPYEILAPIGAGGMGEVYKARDTRLDRAVAVKVLPTHVARVPEARARFEREARTVSALNHPNVCTLFDIGSQDGVDYMVMELVEGETLAERILKGPLPLAQALTYAVQTSDALDKAHRKGVVHRDIKPGNIMIAAAGVKVLDFGLAKGMGQPTGSTPSAGTLPPTVTTPLTTAGSLLGTMQYMAPEQLEGHEADTRTDIFAFGAVLYEMLTGRRAFEARSQATLISAIMSATPPAVSSLQPMTPPALDTLVRRCLEKDPEDRWQSMRDLNAQLQWIAASGSQAGLPAPVSAHRKTRERVWMAATALLLLAGVAVAVWAGVFRKTPVEVGAVRFTVAPPEGVTLTNINPAATQQAVSPDGRQVAFVGDSGGKRYLWVRPLGSVAAQKLERTDDALFPFWSPDSQFIGFAQDDKLKRIPVSGGSPLTICDAPAFEGGTWNRDGVIVFATTRNGPLQRVLAAGGVASPVTTLDKAQQETVHTWPWFLPDGKTFLYLAQSESPGKTGIYAQSLGSPKRTFLLLAEGRAAFVPPNHLLFLRESTLLAQNLDPGSLRLKGEPVSVAVDVRSGGNNGRNGFSVSENGVLAYRAGTSPGNLPSVQISWYGRDGKRTGTVLEAGPYFGMELSPDDKRLVVEKVAETASGSTTSTTIDLWMLDLATTVFSRLTTGAEREAFAVWSADSRRLTFSAESKGAWDIQELLVGSGGPTPLYADGKINYADDASRDGKFLVFHTPGGAGGRGLGRGGGRGRKGGGKGRDGTLEKSVVSVLSMPPDSPGGERKPRVVFESPFGTNTLRLSPDGRWVAYMSTESGTQEIYVAAFPGFTGRRQVSKDGGIQPRWRRDGKELFYLGPGGAMMATEVRSGATLELGLPKALFSSPVGISATVYYYAATGDGQKFLIRESPTAAANTIEQLNLVVNWPAALGR